MQPDQRLTFGVPLLSPGIPVRNLNTDEHTDDDDDEVERDSGPVLGTDVFGDAA